MKNSILIFILLFALNTINAQFFLKPKDHESFNVHLNLDPFASIKENGLNINTEVEYSGRYVYVKGGIEVFTGLPRKPYFDWHGGIGLNLTSGPLSQFRYYTGIRLGRIYRGSYGANPFIGSEAGITYNFSKDIAIGLRGTYDRRSDQALFYDPIFWRFSGYLNMVYTFNRR